MKRRTVNLRIDEALRFLLDNAAARNRRSLSAEVAYRVHRTFEWEIHEELVKSGEIADALKARKTPELPPFVKEGRSATPAELLEWWPELRAKLASMGYEGRDAERYLIRPENCSPSGQLNG